MDEQSIRKAYHPSFSIFLFLVVLLLINQMQFATRFHSRKKMKEPLYVLHFVYDIGNQKLTKNNLYIHFFIQMQKKRESKCIASLHSVRNTSKDHIP